ncbi:MAG: hypothetical protein ABIJ91_01620 [Candidatus Kuenenbacteria bacterium]
MVTKSELKNVNCSLWSNAANKRHFWCQGLQNEIAVKTQEGDFKLLKNGKIEELPEDSLMVREDDVMRHTSMSAALPVKQNNPAYPADAVDAPIGSNKANFYFAIDDEEEARKEKDDFIKDINFNIKNFIDRSAQDILNKMDFVTDERIQRNLRSIIVSRFRNIRGLVEIKEALLKPMEFGGTGFNQEQAEKTIKLIESKREEVEKVIKTGRAPAEQDTQGARQLVKETVKPIRRVAAKEVIVKPSVERKFNKLGYRREDDQEQFSAIHQAMGPVEEIKALTLDNFRKLGKNPDEAADRIAEKINLLEDESIVKKADGIKAWQSSSVYGLYLLIGSASIAEKTTVEEIIVKRKQENKSYLTYEEFDAIADLNRRLAY